jgi:hypothetical protein
VLQSVAARWQDYRGNKLSPFPPDKQIQNVLVSYRNKKHFSFFRKTFLITALSAVNGLVKEENWLLMFVLLFFAHLLTASFSQ